MTSKYLYVVRAILIGLTCIYSYNTVAAGGISLNSTRVIYPKDAKQSTISVRNTSNDTTYLVQSWIENKEGERTKDFLVTPPLYSSAVGNENALRLIYVGKPLPNDRETVYYLNVKGIPSIDKDKVEGKNTLILAAVTRIKLFVRPQKLPIPAADAFKKLDLKREGKMVVVKNPTPYFISLTNIKIDGRTRESIMVSPFSSENILLETGYEKTLTYSTVNDYGAITAEKKIRF